MILTQAYSRVASGFDPYDRAWMVSPQGVIHNCEGSHETYIAENPQEFSGFNHPFDLVDAGWIRVGILDDEFYTVSAHKTTARELDLFQKLSMKIQTHWSRVEIYVEGIGEVHFTRSEFLTASLKDINRSGVIKYSRRQSAIEDHRGRVSDPDEWNEEDVHYFNIGHGDFNEDVGEESGYYVWAWVDGGLDVRGPYGGPHGDESATHGTLWGHNQTDLTYKGRYDEGTGEVSVVVPSRWEHREVPSSLISRLEQRFKPTNIHLF